MLYQPRFGDGIFNPTQKAYVLWNSVFPDFEREDLLDYMSSYNFPCIFKFKFKVSLGQEKLLEDFGSSRAAESKKTAPSINFQCKFRLLPKVSCCCQLKVISISLISINAGSQYE